METEVYELSSQIAKEYAKHGLRFTDVLAELRDKLEDLEAKGEGIYGNYIERLESSIIASRVIEPIKIRRERVHKKKTKRSKREIEYRSEKRREQSKFTKRAKTYEENGRLIEAGDLYLKANKNEKAGSLYKKAADLVFKNIIEKNELHGLRDLYNLIIRKDVPIQPYLNITDLPINDIFSVREFSGFLKDCKEKIPKEEYQKLNEKLTEIFYQATLERGNEVVRIEGINISSLKDLSSIDDSVFRAYFNSLLYHDILSNLKPVIDESTDEEILRIGIDFSESNISGMEKVNGIFYKAKLGEIDIDDAVNSLVEEEYSGVGYAIKLLVEDNRVEDAKEIAGKNEYWFSSELQGALEEKKDYEGLAELAKMGDSIGEYVRAEYSAAKSAA